MIDVLTFGKELKRHDFQFYCGVPCSYLKDLINFAMNDCKYVMATNEGEAIAIASGAVIGGKKSVVLMQNSGLTNATSPLISLVHPFKIPILGFVSLRGESGLKDEPQHELMGEITPDLLSLMKIRWEYLSHDIAEASLQLERANEWIEKDESYFFIVRKGTFHPVEHLKESLQLSNNSLKINKKKNDQLPTRFEALQVIQSLKDQHTIHLATTGKTGRELYEIEDSQNNFYMVGSMGCVSSIGLGMSIAKKDKKFIAIDGDGALLMRLGNLATNGYYSPANLLHILLDNHSYDSTGGQMTVSQHTNFIEMAAACGYKQSIYAHNLLELRNYIQFWKRHQELTFLYMKIAKGSKNGIGRPRQSPVEIKERLQVFLDD
ncbi:phosphonopyruvate decarboxylase [Heyndrickxia oleronia]|uniref:Phosphonopyruvate decarboxylase n=1 Tax=Heyndrickxia oleronia TaxID=38875 RepID=A0A8E2LED7_9BACI|nr:phosphonopyruvate decarboxylase [Heyndrickxia oleronia]NYV63716.1 phosphonopyruvate decarboxylase [Bacillus sp. Gen3]MBU5213304.1 phosphonopyruvate decarboxylase [Heyndrickxia oleronia]MCM3452832.1 phosphonopyruvate decarboxylase [Heyndrickxia oleronia]MEC1373319.1 phosphonopyruvate decarboxylase [Heyndrickxia oleronia]OOP67642.1 phosphonopyruvate decarboxylase [Heyndrickxia oleronia]